MGACLRRTQWKADKEAVTDGAYDPKHRVHGWHSLPFCAYIAKTGERTMQPNHSRLTIAVQGKDVNEGLHDLLSNVRVASRQIAVESGPDDSDVIWICDDLRTKTVLHRNGLIDDRDQNCLISNKNWVSAHLLQCLPIAKLIVTGLRDLFGISLTATEHHPFVNRSHFEDPIRILEIYLPYIH
jgi:hypothetical protein